MTIHIRPRPIVAIACCVAGVAFSAPSAHATTVVYNYGTCVTYGISPSQDAVSPGTYVVTDGVLEARGLPHNNVDGTGPPAFGGSGWAGCGR